MFPSVSESPGKQNLSSTFSPEKPMRVGGHSQAPCSRLSFFRSLLRASHSYRNIRWTDTHCPREQSCQTSSGLISTALPNVKRAGCYRSALAQGSKKFFENEDRASLQPLPVQDPWLSISPLCLIWGLLSEKDTKHPQGGPPKLGQGLPATRSHAL